MIAGDKIKETFSGLVAIDAPSLKEGAMKDRLIEMFRELGITLAEDRSASVTGSRAGNLYGYVKGNGLPPVLLSAHMDTVMPGLGKRAVFHSDGTVISEGTTVLGADDVSGITAIYEALRYLKGTSAKHRDVELLFTTGEELYCKGAKAFDFQNVRAKSAVVLDLSGAIGTAAYAAPTILSFEAEILGRSAHAGFCPENGVHAVKACCEGVARLRQGHIDEATTANVGWISGGDGINIVPRQCCVKGEIRSFYHERALAAADEYRKIFAESAQKYGAQLKWRQQIDICAYETDLKSGIAAAYEKACRQAQVRPCWIKTFGGSDNNVFAQNKIEGIVMAASMHNVHGCEEYANINEIAKAAEIIVRLLTL